MKKYLEILRNCKLFESIEDENLLVMLSCLGAEVMSYTKNQYIFTEGETASHMGILLSGTAQIVRVDFTATGVLSQPLNLQSFSGNPLPVRKRSPFL